MLLSGLILMFLVYCARFTSRLVFIIGIYPHGTELTIA